MQTRQSVISENANKFRGSYVPVYKGDCENRPYHAGTLVGIDLGHRVVLVTARHVLDKDQSNPCDEQNQIYAVIDGQMVQLNRLETALLPLPDGEVLDVLVFVPGSADPQEVVREPVPAYALRREALTKNHYLVACGFPRTKNRRKGKELSVRPYGYFGLLAPESTTRAAGYDPSFHFSIEIDLKRTYRDGLRKVKAAEPQGISGGPVFLVYDFGSVLPAACEFAGIVIARAPNKKSLVCVRADLVALIAAERFGGVEV